MSIFAFGDFFFFLFENNSIKAKILWSKTHFFVDKYSVEKKSRV